MVLNDGKEQIYCPDAEMTQAWNTEFPNYPGKVTKQAKDLGVCQRRGGQSNEQIPQRKAKAEKIGKMINKLPGTGKEM